MTRNWRQLLVVEGSLWSTASKKTKPELHSCNIKSTKEMNDLRNALFFSQNF